MRLVLSIRALPCKCWEDGHVPSAPGPEFPKQYQTWSAGSEAWSPTPAFCLLAGEMSAWPSMPSSSWGGHFYLLDLDPES